MNKAILLTVQLIPLNPGAHEHIYPPGYMLRSQTPFTQGLGEQASTCINKQGIFVNTS